MADGPEEAIQAAWLRARDDLGITVIAPARIEADQLVIPIVVLVPEFGAPRGMAILGTAAAERREADEEALQANAFSFTYLGLGYESYDRELFIDTLNDWGWSSAERAAPDWYTGEPWA